MKASEYSDAQWSVELGMVATQRIGHLTGSATRTEFYPLDLNHSAQ